MSLHTLSAILLASCSSCAVAYLAEANGSVSGDTRRQQAAMLQLGPSAASSSLVLKAGSMIRKRASVEEQEASPAVVPVASPPAPWYEEGWVNDSVVDEQILSDLAEASDEDRALAALATEGDVRHLANFEKHSWPSSSEDVWAAREATGEEVYELNETYYYRYYANASLNASEEEDEESAEFGGTNNFYEEENYLEGPGHGMEGMESEWAAREFPNASFDLDESYYYRFAQAKDLAREEEDAAVMKTMLDDLAHASEEDKYLAAISSEARGMEPEDEDEVPADKPKTVAELWGATENKKTGFEFDEVYYYRYYKFSPKSMHPALDSQSFHRKNWGALQAYGNDTIDEKVEAYYYHYASLDRLRAQKVLREMAVERANEDDATRAARKSLRGAQPVEEKLQDIDLVMLSDRQVGAAASLESVCSNSVDASRLNLHIIGPTDTEEWTLEFLAPACATGRAKMHLYSLDEMTARVEAEGYYPIWKWPMQGGERSNLSVHPAFWDNSSTHKDPFNLLRFYLPHIDPFKNIHKLIFMDDDVIINRDVAEAYDFPLRNGTIMSASCHNWIWSDCDRFRSGTHFSYLDVPYFGYGHIGFDRTVADAQCVSDDQEECAPEGFMEMLLQQSEEINGHDRALTLKLLKQSKAWNYGFNKFDLDAWRANNITQRFVRWMQVNHDIKMFPETSLAYGLGIAMLTKIGRVHCFPPEYDVIQGLGFVGTHDMHNAGINGTGIRKAFGFHFNGPRKPWEHSSGNPFSSYFLQYSQPEVQREFSAKAREHRVKRKNQEGINATSFVVFTDPRSGSEWFMDLLDRHPQMCASGEADDGASSFPREAMIPGRYMSKNDELEAEEEEAAEAEMEAGTNLSFNTVTESIDDELAMMTDEEREKMYNMDLLPPPSELELDLLRNFSPEDEDERMKFADGSLSQCEAKAACSWGSISRHIWKVSVDGPRLCTKERLDAAFYHKKGINRYLGVVCHLRDQAARRLKEKEAANPRILFAEVFKVYYRHLVRHSLTLNDAAFGSFREARQILPCRCPKSAIMHGQKLMHDWMGDLPLKGQAASSWKDHPWAINYNADEASLVLDLPYIDMLGAMAEIGTKAIMFERKNLLARFVSIRTANQTAIYHCASDECVRVARQVKVFVDVDRFRNYVSWTNRRHQENRELVAMYGIPMLEIVYEECVADSEACLVKVCNFLNVTAPDMKMLLGDSQQVKVMGKLAEHIENIDEVVQALTEDGLMHYLD